MTRYTPADSGYIYIFIKKLNYGYQISRIFIGSLDTGYQFIYLLYLIWFKEHVSNKAS